MDKFGKSQSVRRFEDQRFLTGGGRYIDDVAPDQALHAVFVRSQVAHAAFAPLDLNDVRGMPGVRLALAAEELSAAGVSRGLSTTVVTNRDGSNGAEPRRPHLAEGRVRFVGEPMAVIVAETLDQARDAAEAVMPDFDDLPAKVDMTPGGETVHTEAPDNVAFDWGIGDTTAVDAAFASAAHVVKLRVDDNRIICNAMETRGCYAEWDGSRLHFAVNGQGVWGTKDTLVSTLGLEPEQVRVTNPDVGGGFGMKAMSYPEHVPVALAAKMLGAPVRWLSERAEAMQTDNGGRDLISETEMAFDADFKLIGYRVDTVCNLGAYNSGYAQPIQTELFAKVASGVYDVQAVYLRCRGIFTNTTQIDAYRGAGRPEAILVLERSMDNAARVLGVDPWELRRKSFIKPTQFPYKTAIADTYDVGDFERVLARVSTECDTDGFAARRAEAEANGRLRGIGLCYYIESILGDESETSRVAFEEDGTVSLYVGTQSNGQGHETVYATFLADHSGIPVERIRVVQGDSDKIPSGGGTGGSRSVTVQSTATLATFTTVRTGFEVYLADKFDASEVSFDDERFRIAGSNETPTMLEVADMARADGRDDLLDISERITLEARSFPNGAHVAEVEIDPDTGVVTLERYTVTDDFGNLINPMLAEGQVHGGVAQGVGQALTERVVYDDEGQLLTATFMDYAMPRAADVPMIGFTTEAVPSNYNPLGMKGCGEAGTVGALAAISNAVADAVSSRGVALQMPFTPERVWRGLNAAKMAAE